MTIQCPCCEEEFDLDELPGGDGLKCPNGCGEWRIDFYPAEEE